MVLKLSLDNGTETACFRTKNKTSVAAVRRNEVGQRRCTDLVFATLLEQCFLVQQGQVLRNEGRRLS